jgi:hypothetical protein
LKKFVFLNDENKEKASLPQLFLHGIKNDSTDKDHTNNDHQKEKKNIKCMTNNAMQSVFQRYCLFSKDIVIWMTSDSNKLNCSPNLHQNIYLFLFLKKLKSSLETFQLDNSNEWSSPKRPFLTHQPVKNVSASLQLLFSYFFETISYHRDCSQITLLYNSKDLNIPSYASEYFRNYHCPFLKRLFQLSMEFSEKYTVSQIFYHCFPVYVFCLCFPLVVNFLLLLVQALIQ